MSNDFIQLNGCLNCGQAGLDIIPYCRRLIRDFLKAGHVVFDARDVHDMSDAEIELKLFPRHNMRGSWGQELVPELVEELAVYPEQWIRIEKKNYNACHHTSLLTELVTHNITEIHVVGVCTDICVRYTVNGLYEWKTQSCPGMTIFVHSQGVASFSTVGHEESLKHFPIAFGAVVV